MKLEIGSKFTIDISLWHSNPRYWHFFGRAFGKEMYWSKDSGLTTASAYWSWSWSRMRFQAHR